MCMSPRDIVFLVFDPYANRALCINSSVTSLFSRAVVFLRFTHVDSSDWISFPPSVAARRHVQVRLLSQAGLCCRPHFVSPSSRS